MVPWGNKQNAPTEYGYPLKKSEGKYAIARKVVGDVSKTGINTTLYSNMNVLISKINNIANNLYQYSYANSNCIGMIAQLSGWTGLVNNPSGNSYGLLYQDNYEDKPEIRVHTYYTADYYNSFHAKNDYYSLNGDAINSTYYYDNYHGGSHFTAVNQTHVTTYKTSTDRSYYGTWPVFAV